MGDDGQQTGGGKKIWSSFMGMVGSASAIIGLGATLWGGVTWYQARQKQQADLQAKMTLAQSQAKSGEYKAAVETYGDILKTSPTYQPALDGQLDTTMQWVENFSVSAADNETLIKLAIPLLDEIMPVLDAGLARSTGTRAADVQAHIGWAHWLNQHIAEREFGPLTEQTLRAALVTDPNNVYAHGMLGNWILQMHGNAAEAIQHLDAAVATGKARPYVRRLQLIVLATDESSDLQEMAMTRASLMKALNDMRIHAEPLSEDSKRRMLEGCCDTMQAYRPVLVAALSAVPPDDARKTYLWLDDTPAPPATAPMQQLMRRFIDANILEISGNKAQALAEFQAMKASESDELGWTLKESIDAGVKRNSAP